MLKLLFLLILMPTLFSAQIFSQTAPPLETGVSQTLAKWRAANYSDVRYKLNITLEKGAPLLKGEIEIRVKLTGEAAKNDLILDWRTTQFENDKDKPFIDVVAVNESVIKKLPDSNNFAWMTSKEHLIIAQRLLKTGENTIKIQFASPIKTSGSAITRYVDKEDGAEYIYSLFVPSDASTAFPVFDQPDLKARFQLNVSIGGGRQRPDWNVVSNTQVSFSMSSTWHNFYAFVETKPISTYVFAFAAGDFAEMSVTPALAGIATTQSEKFALENAPIKTPANAGVTDLPMKIYVRKSQAEKFKQHAAETFRLNREGVKFLETYFDYKFPFPKYDLVLIPEFPFGGMEHAGATFLRESSIIFPTEPTKNDLVSRANVIFHEAAHQWFGDTVTMKWFDDLWLKEGFAEFMAYKTLEKVMPEYNAWKIFYERNKQAAYLTDSTKGTTPIYQEIPNLSAAKSAYGNIVYRKAPSFLKQAEFYLGEKEFQTAVKAFLKKHEFANAEWTDLVKEFSAATRNEFSRNRPNPDLPYDIQNWTNTWVRKAGLPITEIFPFAYDDGDFQILIFEDKSDRIFQLNYSQTSSLKDGAEWGQKIQFARILDNGKKQIFRAILDSSRAWKIDATKKADNKDFPPLERRDGNIEKSKVVCVFPNYQDYGYGIFLLDEKSRDYVLANIQTEKDDFLRAMMWGALWDAVREGELNPKDYVELVVKNINVETDESTIQTILSRVSTAMNYYLSDEQRAALTPQLEEILIDKMQNSATAGQRITFYRAFLNIASSEQAKIVLRDILSEDFGIGGGNTKMRPGKVTIGGKVVRAANPAIPLRPKDRADIIAKLIVIGDANALDLLKDFEKSAFEDADRYAYAARAAAATEANKAKYWNDFVNDKNISESWIEAAFVTFNSSKQSALTLPYLERALNELPNLKKNRKIFFVNGWLAAFIGGQKSPEALKIVNDFLTKNPNLDRDLRLKILENADGLERAVKIRAKFGNQTK